MGNEKRPSMIMGNCTIAWVSRPYSRQTVDVTRPVTFSDCPWITAPSETIHLVVNAILPGEALLCKAVGSRHSGRPGFDLIKAEN
jgi:hypothetical protein